MNLLHSIIIILIGLLFGACATTKYTTTEQVSSNSLCQLSGENLSALVIWRPQWRPDQKEVADRELAAAKGVEGCFAESSCYSTVAIQRSSEGHGVFSEKKALHMARAHTLKPDRVLIITVRELGPFLKLRLAPVFIKGGTEVVYNINVLDVSTGMSINHFRAHWKNGGAFVIRGVWTLDQDMQSALGSTFQVPPAK